MEEIKKEKEEKCIFCGKDLPEGYGYICKECAEKIFNVNIENVK